MMYNTPQSKKKSLQEKAVAFAFPDMINDDCDASFMDHWNDVCGEDYSAFSLYTDEPQPNHQLDAAAAAAAAAANDISHEEDSMYTTMYEDIEIASNDQYNIRDRLDIERSTMTMTSPTPTATTVAHSNISTLHRTNRRQRPRSKVTPPQQQQKQLGHLTIWEKVLIAIVILIMAACVSATVIVIVRHSRGKDRKAPAALATLPPTSTSAPTTNSGGDTVVRLESIRAWLQVDPAPGTTQYDALRWLAQGDLPYILGDPIPSKQQFDDMSKYNSTSNSTFEQQYAALETFRVHVTQRYALLVFYFATVVDEIAIGGWASLTGARLPECMWPGVDCRDNDAVTSLDIDPSIGFLQGSLPTELGLLSKLDHLMLSFNFLTGDIPSTIYDLTNLHAIRLANSRFSAHLSSSIGKLTQLGFLDLTKGGFAGTLPTEFGFLTNLQYLYLSDNNFSGTIPTQLGSLHILEKAFFRGTLLSGTMPGQVCDLRISSRLASLTASCSNNSSGTNAPLIQDNLGPVGRFTCNCCAPCL